MHHRAARNFDRLPRNHDIRSVGKRTPERFVGLPAHNHGMARRRGLEMLQVLGNMPQQGILIADNAVLGNGNDN